MKKVRVWLTGLAVLIVLSSAGRIRAQEATSSTAAQDNPPARNQTPDAPTPQLTRHQEAEQQLRRQEKQRILGVVPNFNTSNIQDAVSLTPKQKFKLMFRSTTDPFEFVAAGLVAGLGQAMDSHSGYGQGAAGYGKRYGAAYADAVDGSLWGNAILPSLLHQDPRYFRRGHGGFRRRALYAIKTTVWTKNDNGTWGPNYSNVAGNFISGAISNLYYPEEDRGLGLTLEGATIVTAEGGLGSLAVEFWPDVSHKLFHTPLPNTTDVGVH